MDSVFDDINRHRLAPQRFTVGIVVVALCILLSYLTYSSDRVFSSITYCGFILLDVFVLLSFMHYLQNFDAPRAVFLLKLKLVFAWLMLILFGGGLGVIFLSDPGVTRWFLQRYPYIFIIPEAAITLSDILLTVLFGIALQKITNDFVGLTKALGILDAFILPLPYLLLSIVKMVPTVNATYQSFVSLPVQLVIHTLLMSPLFVQLVIFIRARRFRQLPAN